MLSDGHVILTTRLSRSRRSEDGHRNDQAVAALTRRAMSVVIRPTWHDEEALFPDESDAMTLKSHTWDGRYGGSVGASKYPGKAPSAVTQFLKTRSPPSSLDSTTSATGRRSPFNSNTSQRSLDVSMHRSASEPSFCQSMNEHDGDEMECTHETENAGAQSGCSDTNAMETATMRDLRADYVAIHAATDHTSSSDNQRKIIVVVPSIDLDTDELKRVSTYIENYEERQLYHLLMLNDPGVRIIYLSSRPVSEAVVRYYLGLRGNGADGKTPTMKDQLSRLYMLSPDDDSERPLSKKLLSRPLVMHLIKELVGSVDKGILRRSRSLDNVSSFLSTAGLSVFTGSNACDVLAHSLGLRLLESCGETMHFGTKQGSREIFEAAGIPHPAGTPDLTVGDDDLLTLGKDNRPGKKHWAEHHRYIRTPRALATGLARQILLKRNRPRKWMVKLNQGFSGMGNASLNLRAIQDRSYDRIEDMDARIAAMSCDIEAELPHLMFECPCMTWDGCNEHTGFKSQMAKLGVVAEAFLDGEVPTSPSFQAVVEPDSNVAGGHSVRMLSTHEQLLDGQIYEGCINPCSSRYRKRVVEYGKKVGEQLEANGIVGHFSADFLATKNPIDGSWDLNALEINLRQGGTTHPHAHMALLCGGQLNDDGIFHLLNGDPRFYVATDCYRDDGLKGMDEADLIASLQNDEDPHAIKVKWDPESKTGVVFHLFRFLFPYGRVGFAAIGSNSDHAQILYDDAVSLLKQIVKKRTK
mmetsp:Transcript_29754/g.64430  ORF Transcript_29754/g.64430 Transcript_29754/m.64430 type:complete len:752 (-) Transcript_29754:41-2296(-)